MKALIAALAACALVVVVIVGLSQAGGDGGNADSRRAAAPAPRIAGAPAPIASLHAQGNQLLDGGPAAFRRRLRELRGYPVVVNKWASWCGPCRAEFPFFQRLAVELGREVAFIGVNSSDNDGAAREFLREFPVSYPHYRDPDLEVARVFNGVAAFPVTAFYDARGKMQFLHQGGYRDEAALRDDIERYTG